MKEGVYNYACDMWGLGISALAYCFNEDYNVFYDWAEYRIN